MSSNDPFDYKKIIDPKTGSFFYLVDNGDAVSHVITESDISFIEKDRTQKKKVDHLKKIINSEKEKKQFYQSKLKKLRKYTQKLKVENTALKDYRIEILESISYYGAHIIFAGLLATVIWVGFKLIA